MDIIENRFLFIAIALFIYTDRNQIAVFHPYSPFLCYVDSEGHCYDFGFGMNFEGIIVDERTRRYHFMNFLGSHPTIFNIFFES